MANNSNESDSNECLLDRLNWFKRLVLKISRRLYYALFVKDNIESDIDRLIAKYKMDDQEFVDKIAEMMESEFENTAERLYREGWSDDAIENYQPEPMHNEGYD